MSDNDLAQRVRDFWFGAVGSETHGKSRPEWFKKDDAFDDSIRDGFLSDVEAALVGDLDALGLDNAPDCLSLLILLGQFPRNLFRVAAKSFAGDERALAFAAAAIDKGFDTETPKFQRFFFYLPFEHSEDLADQQRCVELVRAQDYEDLLKWAMAHHDIIARFGRFPHRNDVLGRESTAEEIEFLTQPNSSF